MLIFLFISILIVGFDAVSTCKPKLRRYFKIDVLLLNYQNLVGKSLRVFFFFFNLQRVVQTFKRHMFAL